VAQTKPNKGTDRIVQRTKVDIIEGGGVGRGSVRVNSRTLQSTSITRGIVVCCQWNRQVRRLGTDALVAVDKECTRQQFLKSNSGNCYGVRSKWNKSVIERGDYSINTKVKTPI